MAGALEGFVTGFANTTAPLILERKKEARDFFNKQVEYARTTGLQNRNRVRQEADANLAIARQLEQAGVPRELIMAQINQDPTGLGKFYEAAEKIRASAVRPLTAEEWKAAWKVGGNFKAPDEDLATFIYRTYDPIANATRSPTFSDDPEGNIIASMMGFSAMDEARAELGRTEIAEGLTAEQLIQYGDTQPQRIGGTAVVTQDYDALRDVLPAEDLSISETNTINTIIEDRVNLGTMQMEEWEDATTIYNDTVDYLTNLFPTISPERIASMVEGAITSRGYTLGASETPAEGDIEVSPIEGVPVEEAPSPALSAPLTAEEVGLAVDLFGVESVVDNGDGTSTVTYNGKSYPMNNAELRDVIETKLKE
jgi:hypothetical protein